MTVKEMLARKYEHQLKTMSAVEWRRVNECARVSGKHPARIMYMAIEITANDIWENGGWNGELWAEISAMHKEKLLASNAHRQYSGHVTKYWLTDKGWRAINKGNAIC